VRVVEDSDLAYRAAKPNKVAEDHSYPQSEVLIKDKKHDRARIDKTHKEASNKCDGNYRLPSLVAVVSS